MTNERFFDRERLPGNKKTNEKIKKRNYNQTRQSQRRDYDVGDYLSDVGNQEIANFFESILVQPKLNVSQPGDIYEQEADRIAKDIINNQRVKKTKISHKKANSNIKNKSLNDNTETEIKRLKGRGKPLDKSLKEFFSSRFDEVLDNIRIHTDPEANRLASYIQAKAFTHGNDIVFGEGQYQPETASGKELIAHELVHTVQQDESTNVINRYVLTGKLKNNYGYKFDGHLNIYGKNGDDNNPKKDLIVFYKDIEKVIIKYKKKGLKEDEVFLINGYEMTINTLIEMYITNALIIQSCKKQMESEDIKYLLEDGHISYLEALKVDEKIKSSPSIPALFEHWNIRYILNQNKDFYSISSEERKEKFANPKDRIKAEKKDSKDPARITFNFNDKLKNKYGKDEEWTLLTAFASKYHGMGNYKWVSNFGRELVVKPDGSLENRPEKMGTYNFGENVPHFYYDMLPYWDKKNLPADITSDLERLVGPQLDPILGVVFGPKHNGVNKSSVDLVIFDEKINSLSHAAVQLGYEDWQHAANEGVLFDLNGKIIPNNEIRSWYNKNGKLIDINKGIKLGYTLLSKEISDLFKKNHKYIEGSLSDIIGKVKYRYDIEQRIFTTTTEALQEGGGYFNRYDEIANSGIGFRIDFFDVEFEYNKKIYHIRGWKGNYWSASGAEIGAYTGKARVQDAYEDAKEKLKKVQDFIGNKDLSKIIEDAEENFEKYIGFDKEKGTGVSKEFMPNMGFVLLDGRYNVIMHRYMEDNWWVIGLKPGVNETWEDLRGKLTMKGVINFKEDTGMAKAFDKEFKKNTKINSYERRGNIFIFDWK